jgi:hypothetical protein
MEQGRVIFPSNLKIVKSQHPYFLHLKNYLTLIVVDIAYNRTARRVLVIYIFYFHSLSISQQPSQPKSLSMSIL